VNGYWTGTYAGSNFGTIVVEIDDRGSHFEGCAYTYDGNPAMPSTFAIVKTPNKNNQLQFQADLVPIDPSSYEPTLWNKIKHLYAPTITIPATANVTCNWSHQSMHLSWTTNIPTFGSCTLPKSHAAKPSTLVPLPTIKTWADFRSYATKLEEYRYIFRGQSAPWRLQTPYHRTGRGDTRRFWNEDMQYLQRHLSACMNHVFDLSDPIQNAALMHLAQHHGYPTPLLDWTYSPFIAAYFAFNQIKSADAAVADEGANVRIFILDKDEWCAKSSRATTMSARYPNLTVLEPLSIGNQRLIPQRALSTYSTVDDIETFIQIQSHTGAPLLDAIDLPLRERDQVMKELRQMGITAGLLFPGIEGACQELRERFFRYAT
jgi:hypothetical protein